ncbi:YTH-domain-containing protein [Daldinia vernicosa]|uniref:YTH-domain-containing protein n=1 Tax=Daldinia vernicosa TaxID=114800 RepID=UPI0020078019|nr:YTH-domain-containing protein [Daldinia vernicosa]KAI0851169.1 YTH-domain-containing protein [Daldinia vernicosa]
MEHSEHPRTSPNRARDLRDSGNTGIESMLAPDVQDWLKLTGWHDIDYRAKKLAAYRNTGAGKEKHDIGKAKLATGVIKKDLDSVLADIPQDSSLVRVRHTEPEGLKNSIEVHRGRDSRDLVVPTTHARSVSPHRFHHHEHDKYPIRGYSRVYYNDYDRPLTPRGSPLRYIVRPTGRPTHTTERIENYDSPNRERVDDQRDLTREMIHLRHPKQLVLKGKGEVCFFVMRSYSWSHVYDSMDDGLWATQRPNAEILSKVFASGKTVVLFFAVNKSHGFQGYALMKSLPSADIRPMWWYGVKWNISEPFKVEWISTMHVDSKHVVHISNRLNEDLPVTRARNGQEIDENAGRQMVCILESRGVEEYKRARRIGSLSKQ